MSMKVNKTKGQALYEILLSLNKGNTSSTENRVDIATRHVCDLEKEGIEFADDLPKGCKS